MALRSSRWPCQRMAWRLACSVGVLLGLSSMTVVAQRYVAQVVPHGDCPRFGRIVQRYPFNDRTPFQNDRHYTMYNVPEEMINGTLYGWTHGLHLPRQCHLTITPARGAPSAVVYLFASMWRTCGWDDVSMMRNAGWTAVETGRQYGRGQNSPAFQTYYNVTPTHQEYHNTNSWRKQLTPGVGGEFQVPFSMATNGGGSCNGGLAIKPIFQPTAAPASSLPTQSPTVQPSRHACETEHHECDRSEFGICERIDNSAGYRCNCVRTHHCVPDCQTPNHTCEWNTESPSTTPTGVPSVAPTSIPSVYPTYGPSYIPTTMFPSTISPSTSTPTTNVPTIGQGRTSASSTNSADGTSGRSSSNSDSNESQGDENTSDSTIIAVVVASVIIVALVVVVGALLIKKAKRQADGSDREASFDNPMYETSAENAGASSKSIDDLSSSSGYMDVPTAVGSGYTDVAPTAVGSGYMDVAPTQEEWGNAEFDGEDEDV